MGWLEPLLGEISKEFTLAAVLASVILTLLERGVLWAFEIKPRRRVAFWGCAIALNCFLVLSAIGLIRQRPEVGHLAASIEQRTFADTSGSPPRLLAIMNLRVINTGAPTAVTGFGATIRLGGKTYNGTLIAQGRELTVPFVDGSSVTFNGSDDITQKTLTPIPRGGFARGVAMFTFEDLNTQTANTTDAQFEFRVTDAWGQLSRATTVIGPLKKSAVLVSIPGLQQRAQPPPTSTSPRPTLAK